ncbi:OmpA family protein [Croceibacterium ferulae]|uniref:OmpA family protein n=1 Tax=Croceibacterium ferulae TaxID=1854641 RepID=UPI000EB31DE3|nr:OmpA family protein [Croceibacterium ferulae]
MTATIRTTLLVSGMLGAVLLAGCRDAGSDPAPEASPTAQEPPVISVPSATPSETAVASIIRPDVASEPAVDLPPEPLALTVSFPEGARLTQEAETQLTGMLEAKALKEGWPIVLRGHSDSDGTDGANLATSRRRAQAVADWLVAHGIDKARIRVIALGEQNPAAPNARPDGTPDDAGRARNRRVEITVAAPEGGGASAGQEEQRGPSAAQRLTQD